jgi:7-carboxy-7-deazaguanine synthase
VSKATIHGPLGSLALNNPLTSDSLFRALRSLAADHSTQVSETVLAVTGGEPLQQVEFLSTWLPRFPGPVLLETAGILPESLKSVLPYLDFLSLDWKDPADVRVGAEKLTSQQCLRMAVEQKRSRPDFRFWTKFVIGAQSCLDWLGDSLQRLAEIAPSSEVYLQPVSPQAVGPRAPASEDLLNTLLRWRHLPLQLRVVPQVHPLLGVR